MHGDIYREKQLEKNNAMRYRERERERKDIYMEIYREKL